MKFDFPKSARLLKKTHYQRVFRARQKLVGHSLIIDYRKGDGGARPKLGISVSKRYGKAHDRNRFKRLVRESFRLFSFRFPLDLEINVTPRPNLETPSKKVCQAEILDDFQKLSLRVHVEPK